MICLVILRIMLKHVAVFRFTELSQDHLTLVSSEDKKATVYLF